MEEKSDNVDFWMKYFQNKLHLTQPSSPLFLSLNNQNLRWGHHIVKGPWFHLDQKTLSNSDCPLWRCLMYGVIQYVPESHYTVTHLMPKVLSLVVTTVCFFLSEIYTIADILDLHNDKMIHSVFFVWVDFTDSFFSFILTLKKIHLYFIVQTDWPFWGKAILSFMK